MTEAQWNIPPFSLGGVLEKLKKCSDWKEKFSATQQTMKLKGIDSFHILSQGEVKHFKVAEVFEISENAWIFKPFVVPGFFLSIFVS